MKIVIDIPKKTYNEIKERTIVTCGEIFAKNLVRRIRNGTPLPKGHGDLIDRKDLIENGISKGFCNWYDEIKMADTIIPADKGSESE